MTTTEGSKTMKISPRIVIQAAMYIGDEMTSYYCPTGLSNAGSTQIEALVAEAIIAGMEVE